MHKYAQILNDKVYWIFEDKMTLEEIYSYKFNNTQIVLMDITNIADVKEEYGYDGANFIPPLLPPTPPLTQEQIIDNYTRDIQIYLDNVAKTRNYDGILSLCTYATSTVPKFKLEGQAGVLWRDAVWAKCYEIMAEVQAGTREVPEDIISELPVINWSDDV